MPHLLRRPALGAVLGSIAALVTLIAGPAGAIGRRVDLTTMTARAGTIVAGRIVSIRAGSHPRYPKVGALFVTVQVSDMIKGTPARKFTFMQIGGRAPAHGKSLMVGQTLADLPAYRVGEELVLFLYPPSAVGFTSPVGGEQGMFMLQRQPGQPTTLISEGGNRLLAVNGTLPPSLKPSQQRLLLHPSGALDYQTFRSTVKQLMQSGK